MIPFGRLRSAFDILAPALLTASYCVAAFAGYCLQPLPQPLDQARQPKPTFTDRFVAAAIERTHHIVRYDPAYVRIPYPGGDVSPSTGVCTDEVIRAYRAVGIDLQKEVHEDMERHFALYPHNWSSVPAGSSSFTVSSYHKTTDTNIDHRRVPNLMMFFSRRGKSLPLSSDALDYRPGDLVAWNLGGQITHIGIVVDQKSPQSGRNLIVHNIGQGPQMQDVLFNWKIIGHYRYPVRDSAP